MRPPERKRDEQKAVRQGVRRARKAARRLGSVSAVLSSCQLCAHICFAHNFGGALAPLGSPPERLALSNYSSAGFLPRLFFLTAARKSGRGAGVLGGAARRFLVWAAGAARGESAAAVGGAAALCAPFRQRSRSARFAAGSPPFRRRVFAHKAFSLSGICARRN